MAQDPEHFVHIDMVCHSVDDMIVIDADNDVDYSEGGDSGQSEKNNVSSALWK